MKDFALPPAGAFAAVAILQDQLLSGSKSHYFGEAAERALTNLVARIRTDAMATSATGEDLAWAALCNAKKTIRNRWYRPEAANGEAAADTTEPDELLDNVTHDLTAPGLCLDDPEWNYSIDSVSDEDPTDGYAKFERRHDCEVLLRLASPKQREVLMRRLDAIDDTETAAELQIAISTVASLAFRGVDQIRKGLESGTDSKS
jgi:DNA-directed RNA polymerase specialized sigma24 family protein